MDLHLNSLTIVKMEKTKKSLEINKSITGTACFTKKNMTASTLFQCSDLFVYRAGILEKEVNL